MVIAGAAIVVVLAGLAVAGWQEHWPPAVFGRAAPVALTWSAAQAPLPADAARTSSQQASLNDVTCPSAQNCLAVGYYTISSNSNTRPLVETFSHGTWTPAAVVPDLAATSQTTFAYLDGISCDTVGSCVAVGGYFDSKNIEKPLVEGLYGGTWASGNAALPGDADQTKSAYLSDVSCPARGNCVATGWYTDQNGDSQGLIDTMSGGTWHAAKAPLPAGAASRKASSTNVPTAVYLLRCPAVGSCVANGHYTDQHGDSRGLIETLSGGTWTAINAPLPGDAAADPVSYLWTVACPASGTCLAIGSYIDRNGQNRNLVETLSGGTWTAAAAPYPNDAAASQKWTISQVTGFTADACREVGSCVAIGSYIARTGGVQGLIDTLSAGTWTAARAPLPGDAATAKQYAYFNGAACLSADECVTVGGYKPQNGNTAGLIETGMPARSK